MGLEMVPWIFTVTFLFVKKCSIHVMILTDMPRKIRESSMERWSMCSNALSRFLKATNTGLFLLGHFLDVILVAKWMIGSSVDLSLMNQKIFFVLGVFHWSFARIILSIIFERVDNREMGRWWPFPPGLAIGMTTAVSIVLVVSLQSRISWITEDSLLKGTWGFGIESVGKAVLSRGCLSMSSQHSLKFVEGKQPVCVWIFLFCCC